MGLLDVLDGAELVVVDRERGLLFIWNGSATVNVVDEEGRAVDGFMISRGFERRISRGEAAAAIAAMRETMFDEEE